MLLSPSVAWRSRADWQGEILAPLSPQSHAPVCPGTPVEEGGHIQTLQMVLSLFPGPYPACCHFQSLGKRLMVLLTLSLFLAPLSSSFCCQVKASNSSWISRLSFSSASRRELYSESTFDASSTFPASASTDGLSSVCACVWVENTLILASWQREKQPTSSVYL